MCVPVQTNLYHFCIGFWWQTQYFIIFITLDMWSSSLFVNCIRHAASRANFGEVAAGCGVSFCVAAAALRDIVMLSKSPFKTCCPNSFYGVSCNSVLQELFCKSVPQVRQHCSLYLLLLLFWLLVDCWMSKHATTAEHWTQSKTMPCNISSKAPNHKGKTKAKKPSSALPSFLLCEANIMFCTGPIRLL